LRLDGNGGLGFISSMIRSLASISGQIAWAHAGRAVGEPT